MSGAAAKPRINWRNTFTKMFIDCITIGALLNTVAFLVLMGLLKGHTMEKLSATVRRVSAESHCIFRVLDGVAVLA